MIVPGDVRRMNAVAVEKVQAFKKGIEDHLRSGDRNFARLRELVEYYADAQLASDVLSGQARMEVEK